MSTNPSPSTAAARPSVIQLSIKEKAALYAAYIPLFADGGIFIPSSREYRLGDDVYVLLSLPDDPQRYPVAGKVAWVTPAKAQGARTQGAGSGFPLTKSRANSSSRLKKSWAPAWVLTAPPRRSEPSFPCWPMRRTMRCPSAFSRRHPSRMFTDSHCHLNFPELRSQLPDILQAMSDAQVTRALCICTTLEEFEDVYSLARDHDHLWATVGVHPDNEGVQEPTLDDLLQGAARPRVVGIGETGLDYYRLGDRSVADMAWQRERFRTHIRAARQTALPLVIHTRSASDDTLAILREEGGFASAHATGQPAATGVFHCFTETMDVARAALDLGFYISFSGILTFRNAADLRDVAAFVPLDRILIETDSPYLAPVPYRGKTNSPAYVPWVAQQVADLKGVSVETVATTTSRNFDVLFAQAGQAV